MILAAVLLAVFVRASKGVFSQHEQLEARAAIAAARREGKVGADISDEELILKMQASKGAYSRAYLRTLAYVTLSLFVSMISFIILMNLSKYDDSRTTVQIVIALGLIGAVVAFIRRRRILPELKAKIFSV